MVKRVFCDFYSKRSISLFIEKLKRRIITASATVENSLFKRAVAAISEIYKEELPNSPFSFAILSSGKFDGGSYDLRKNPEVKYVGFEPKTNGDITRVITANLPLFAFQNAVWALNNN